MSTLGTHSKHVHSCIHIQKHFVLSKKELKELRVSAKIPPGNTEKNLQKYWEKLLTQNILYIYLHICNMCACITTPNLSHSNGRIININPSVRPR